MLDIYRLQNLKQTFVFQWSSQVIKRPSIEELLADPVVNLQQSKMEHRQTSLQSDSSSDLKTWETELRALEKELEEKKRDLDSKLAKYFIPDLRSISIHIALFVEHFAEKLILFFLMISKENMNLKVI